MAYNMDRHLEWGQPLLDASNVYLRSMLAGTSTQLRRVVSHIRDAACPRLVLDLLLAFLASTVWMITARTLAPIQTAIAEPYIAHTELEFRLGGGVLNGTSVDNDEGVPRTIKMTAQIFADRLFPVTTIGDGVVEIGPYARGAYVDGGNIPLIAGGVILGYRFGNYEILVNGGLAYTPDRIGETASDRLGQTKHTYDLGLSLRYDIDRFFISAGYQHNSNGSHVGLNFIPGRGSNPGYDTLFAGVGIHF